MHLKRYLLRLWNLWPPFLFCGIKIIKRTQDDRHIVVKLKLRFWNSNYLGTQYGGAMFSMVDPFYMVMLINNLGSKYTVWDKSANIQYLRPGRTDLITEFRLTEEDLASIRKTVDEHGKMNWVRTVEIKDKEGLIVAEVEKVISIKRKHEL